MKKISKPTGGSRKRSRAPQRKLRRPFVASATRALAAFAEIADQERIRWYLFGAQAVAVYGIPRTTGDIDITIELGDRALSSITDALTRAGFMPLIRDEGFTELTRIYPVIHEPTRWKVDFVLAGPGIETRFLDEVRVFEAGKTKIPVIAPEHLAALKVLAGRPKDLEDVRGLIRIASLDHVRVRETLELLERSLDQSDLVPLYERLCSEAKRHVT